MSAPLEVSDLAEVLKELRDSIKEQNVLLKTFITQQGAAPASNVGEDGQESVSKTSSEDKDTHMPREEKQPLESTASNFDEDEQLSSELSSVDKDAHIQHDNEQGSDSVSFNTSSDESSRALEYSTEEDEESVLAHLITYYPSSFKDRVAFYRVDGAPSGDVFYQRMGRSLANTLPAAPPPLKGTPSSSWKYWIPLFVKDLGRNNVQFAASKSGRPDYVPPWELRKFENQLFHVDDVERKEPVEFSEDDICESTEIPYSFTPPVSVKTHGHALIATTGIAVDQRLLHTYVGSLYSVPPDGRIPLPFEKNELRLMSASGEISNYLHKVGKTFENLYQEGGKFEILDVTLGGSPNSYSWKDEMQAEWKDQPYYWKFASPALYKENAGLQVPPSAKCTLLDAFTLKKIAKRQRSEGSGQYYGLKAEDNVVRRPLLFHSQQRRRNWHRLIYCQGLASIMGTASRSPNPLTDVEQIWSLLLYSSRERPRLRPQHERIVREALNAHIFCSRIQRAGNHYLLRWKPFHITWFEKFSGNREDALKSSSWKYGELYGSKESCYIRETAFTFAILPYTRGRYDRKGQGFSAGYEDVEQVRRMGMDFWTILLLTPLTMDLSTYNPALYALVLIKEGLQQAASAWEAMRTHFTMILDDQNTMMSPRKHDELLFDDDTFSRSRLYFWAVDSLEIFITQIKDTISQWEDFWVARQKMIWVFYKVTYKRKYDIDIPEPNETENREWLAYETNLQEVEDQISRLKDYQVQFESFRAKTLALREGLFNASSVIESRAATRLGENVKLLTYVSIFYLPLAFCAGLWSINETYNTTAFAITSVLVAAGTYVFVANLGNTVTTLTSLYRLFKKPIAERMAKDPEQKWAEKGEGFTSFEPDRKAVKPSEWYLLQYWILEILRKVQIRGKRPKERQRNQV